MSEQPEPAPLEQPAADAQPAQDQPAGVPPPEGVPEKFWDAEAGQLRQEQLLKSYTELEKLHSRSVAATGAAIPDNAAAQLDKNAGMEAVLARAGLTTSDVVGRFADKGELTNDQYAALEKQGYAKGVCDEILRDKVALATQAQESIRASLVAKVGGEEQLTNLIGWAAQNLTPQEQANYNRQIADTATATMAGEWLIAKHKAAVGATNSAPLLSGDGSATSGATAFGSQREMFASMDKANADPTLQAAHEARLLATENPEALPY